MLQAHYKVVINVLVPTFDYQYLVSDFSRGDLYFWPLIHCSCHILRFPNVSLWYFSEGILSVYIVFEHMTLCKKPVNSHAVTAAALTFPLFCWQRPVMFSFLGLRKDSKKSTSDKEADGGFVIIGERHRLTRTWRIGVFSNTTSGWLTFPTSDDGRERRETSSVSRWMVWCRLQTDFY